MSSSPYNEASRILNQVLSQSNYGSSSGLKSIAFKNTKNIQKQKAAYAQVCQTLKYKSLIDTILSSSNLQQKIKYDEMRNKGLCYVMLYELLFGKFQSIRGGGFMKRNIVKFEEELRRVKKDVVKDFKGNVTKVPVFPRYVRVNTLKCTVEEVLKVLQSDLSKLNGDDKEEEKMTAIYADPHVPNLLVLHPKTASVLHSQHVLVQEGKIVLQDKSSCFSALALVHGDGRYCGKNNNTEEEEEEGDYIDACAAPGNKTTHLASLLAELPSSSNQTKQQQNKKKKKKITVYACDRSSQRISILKQRLSTIIPSNNKEVEVQPLHQDFLKINPQKRPYPNVKSILLDPSCSGSGIVNTPDRHFSSSNNDDKTKKEEKERVESLSNFQLLALRHAMSFPNVRKIVYSTCSIYQREDEDVVFAAIKEHNEECQEEEKKWRVIAPKCLGHWKRRGQSSRDGKSGDNKEGVADVTEEELKCLIRCDGMDGDETNGFFVCYLERGGNRTVGSKDNVNDDNEGGDGSSHWSNWPPKGINLYNGEFANIVTEDNIVNDECENDHDNTDDEKMDGVDKKENKQKSNPSSTKTKKTEDKKSVNKKRNKKNEWKRKQMEQKMKRLEKKKKQKEQNLSKEEEEKK